LDGRIGLATRAGGQGIFFDINANSARFGGATPLTIARAELEGKAYLKDGNDTIDANITAEGLSYGSLFIGRLAAAANLQNGQGIATASIAGRRGSRFAMQLNADVTPERGSKPASYAIAARGEFAGSKIRLPRRAILSKTADGQWQLARTQIYYGEGSALVAGQFGGGQTALNLALDKMPLSIIDLAYADIGLGGKISGELDFRKVGAAMPTGSARVKIDNLTRSGLVLTSRPIDLTLVSKLTANSLDTRAIIDEGGERRGRLQARVSGLAQTGNIVDRVRKGNLRAELRYGGPAAALWRLSGVEAFDITGPISIATNITGSFADPTVRGSLASDDLRLRSALSGTDIRNVSALGTFDGSRLQLKRFSGKTDNGGTVSGSGFVDFQDLGSKGPSLDIRVAAKNARLLNANGLDATITGPLRIISSGVGGTIAGRVAVDRASWKLGSAATAATLPQIKTREINLPADIAPIRASFKPWNYLIDATARSRIDVDGMGLDSEWGADIILRGTTQDPRIGGEARVVRGYYSFAGTRFELTRGRIAFDASVPIDPRLDIVAETKRDGIDVSVKVQGNALKPEITFSSTPLLPEEEILARLLFGGSITELSATDALQLGTALASLRGGSGLDPINKLRTAIGLDRLRIVAADPALGQGTGVAVGKNIGRRFYVEIITDGRGYSATEAEFRITSWLSLLASVSTIGRESAVLEVSRDY
ncbi:MAG: translocation/assembly module TamB domain-containing protein, partial [Pontixanthobacter sp.]